jgi:hypothetical protein
MYCRSLFVAELGFVAIGTIARTVLISESDLEKQIFIFFAIIQNFRIFEIPSGGSQGTFKYVF